MSIYGYLLIGVVVVTLLGYLASLRLRAMSGKEAPKVDELRAESWRETERLYCAGLDALRANEFERAGRELGLAAERGHARAQLYFGVLREQGLGVQADLESARQWYRRAAAQGDADAYSRLRVLSDTPVGMQSQAQLANAWAYDNVAVGAEKRAAQSSQPASASPCGPLSEAPRRRRLDA